MAFQKKLRRIPSKLNQMQDLGGCRAILPSMRAANALIQAFRDNPLHEFFSESDYIANPKPGGYRCHHVIYKFKGAGESEVFNGRRIEVQIRSRLQHSWATAVEAVGLFLKQDLKAGIGNASWLRLLELMSAELAVAEDCPEPQGVPSRSERVRELRELDRELRAVGTLENLRQAVRFTDTYTTGGDKPRYYRIQYDNRDMQVVVSPHTIPIAGVAETEAVEQQNTVRGDNRFNTVFVEADRIEDLKEAFPNYFGDVQMFAANLRDITRGYSAKEYTMPPQQTVPPGPKEVPDMSWFRKPKRWTEPVPKKRQKS